MHHEYHSFLFDEFPYISQDSLVKIPPEKYYRQCLLQLWSATICIIYAQFRFQFQVPVPVSQYRCIAVSLFSTSRKDIGWDNKVLKVNQFSRQATIASDGPPCRTPSIDSAKRNQSLWRYCDRKSRVKFLYSEDIGWDSYNALPSSFGCFAKASITPPL